jgi:hypothetical protein
VHRRVAIAAALTLLLVAAAPVAARAADPGRWVQMTVSSMPIEYYQGMTHGPGQLFFDGIYVGGYRADLGLREQARNPALLPLEVTAAEGFNHIGDWTFTGGRLILPLECYTPGGPNGGNTCGRGALGVADPNLGWLGRTLLDPADIPKAMWAEASPDGQLIWTSSGNDLLAYAAADVRPDAGDVPIRPVKRLTGAVPPSGITGATFVGDRLYLAGQTGGPFQVWSVDLATGARRLEIERTWAGESEGLDTVDALGGVLHWMVQPLDPQGRTATFGVGHGAMITFIPSADAVVRLRVTPTRLRAGRSARVSVGAAVRFAGVDHPLAGVRVRAGGASARTDPTGFATLRLRPKRAGKIRVTGTKRPLRAGRAVLKAAARRRRTRPVRRRARAAAARASLRSARPASVGRRARAARGPGASPARRSR